MIHIISTYFNNPFMMRQYFPERERDLKLEQFYPMDDESQAQGWNRETLSWEFVADLESKTEGQQEASISLLFYLFGLTAIPCSPNLVAVPRESLNSVCFHWSLALCAMQLGFDLTKFIPQIAKDSPDSELLSASREVQVTRQQHPAVATTRHHSKFLSWRMSDRCWV